MLSFVLLVWAAAVRCEAATVAPAEFHFEFREGLLWAQVHVAGRTEPLHFLVDSGAGVSVISLDTAKRLGLALGPKVRVNGVRTSMIGHWPQTLSATAGNVPLPSGYLVLDLSKLSRACERPVDGLIGADVFRDRIVQIDFRTQTIRLLNPDQAPASAHALPLEVRRCGLRVKACVNRGKAQWLRVDTGCASALEWVTSSVRPDECSGKLAVGLAELTIPQTRTTVELGSHTFQDVPTGLHHKAIFDGEAGLLGNGLLSRFDTVTIDTKSGRLLLSQLRDAK